VRSAAGRRDTKKPPAKTIFAGGPADIATGVAGVPWLCVTVFRRLCSESACSLLASAAGRRDKKKPPAIVFAGGPADVATYVAVVP
jgi:hypothetical protein